MYREDPEAFAKLVARHAVEAVGKAMYAKKESPEPCATCVADRAATWRLFFLITGAVLLAMTLAGGIVAHEAFSSPESRCREACWDTRVLLVAPGRCECEPLHRDGEVP